MQEFFMDYGLWLLVGLLVVIALIFLLSGRRKGEQPIEPALSSEAAPPPAPTPFVDPIIAAPVAAAPVAVESVVAEPAIPLEEKAPEPAPASASVEPTPVAAPEPVAPVPVAAASVAAAPVDGEDDLLRLKGVGPKLKALLIDLGVTRYAQIAAWSDTDIATIDAKLGNFKGRPVRDQWVDQAKYLAAGDIAGFEAKYGKV